MQDGDDPTRAHAEWKKIQQNTFTRWCNYHLKSANLYIYSLETDLCDGLKLIALLEVLSQKRISRYNHRPEFRPQKIENIAIALKFVEDENIRLVNIDASDILKGNLKLILGLIWTLILKYVVSTPDAVVSNEEGADVTPKQNLLAWVREKVPKKDVNGFYREWNDGVLVGALVEAMGPGLCPDWEKLDPKNKVDNLTMVMGLAEQWLGVPQLITPDELSNPNVDELSVMTYVCHFVDAKLKPGAPLKST